MYECYAMQILENKESKSNRKDGHKEKSDEAQGPCQKNSIRLSLLLPKLFRCNSSIEVILQIRILSNFKIGIKV